MEKKRKKSVKKKAVKKKVVKKKAVKKAVKKTTKKKTARKTVPTEPLTADEVVHFKDMLLKKRREILGDVNSIEDETLKKSRLDAAGDLSSMPIHMADIGTDNYEQEFALGLLDSERKILHEINDALIRIEKKVYGICEVTEKPISKRRLEAKPWARYCIEYARMVEQGLVEKGEIPEEEEE